jgi:hypothetical protein
MIDRLPQTPIDTPGTIARQNHAHPQDVVGDDTLTTIEKRQILNEWAEQAKARKQETGEVARSGANWDLGEIEQALDSL